MVAYDSGVPILSQNCPLVVAGYKYHWSYDLGSQVRILISPSYF